jgi:hypothetical protein
MMLRSFLLSSVVLFALLAGGCASTAGDSGYPSLARRAVELRLNAPSDSPPPAPPPPQVTTDLVTAISALEADASRGDAAFQAELTQTQRLVAGARGNAVGSEAWFVAQAALSGLDQTLRPSRLALAELDRLHVAAEMDGRMADAEALAAAAGRVAAMAAAQRTAFDQLGGLLSNGS